METIDIKKDKIQREALTAWINSGKCGTLEIITGLGKNRIALEAAKMEPEGAKILFLAEVTDRERELKNEQKKWGAESIDIKFACYQTAYKWIGTKWDLVIYDEIHSMLTKEYSKFHFNNDISHIMGLSATVDRRASVESDADPDLTKGDLIRKVAPVCYTYGMDKGQIEGTARKLDVYVITHHLDVIHKSIIAGTKADPFSQTELSAYNYRDQQFQRAKSAPEHIRVFKIRSAAGARARLLYDLPSKIPAVRNLLAGLKAIEGEKSKSIVFGNSLNALHQITPNVIASKNRDGTSRNDLINKLIRDAFEEGELNVIAAFKKLEQGANLSDLNNCILMSYYSKSRALIQRTGRLRDNGTIGRVFIFVTFGTQETKWFDTMFEDINELNLIYCKDVSDCLSKLKNDGTK